MPSQSAGAPDLYNSGIGTPAVQEPTPPAELRQEMQDLHDFMEDSDGTSSLGMVLHEDHRAIDGNGEVAGLLIVEVMPGTAAAMAGLRGLHAGIANALTGIAFAASLFFPPASLAAAAVSGSRIGESYDMIVGVDSERVTNFLQFSDRMHFARPGEIVYLSISRNGRRIQVPVTVPVGAVPGSP
jgi:S1-C subfamily serine protease